MLEVDRVETFYGMSQALFGLSLTVGSGETVALVGRNGAGKTTTMRTILGLNPPRTGRVVWRGKDVTGARVHHLARRGMGWVPEDRRIFADLTVDENLDVARAHGTGRADTSGEEWTPSRVFSLFPDLESLRARRGGVLSGGQQQMLSIARTLLLSPRLLLLDEPSEGLAPKVVEHLAIQLRELKQAGVAMLMAEQNLGLVLGLSDRVHVLEKGAVSYSGTPDQVRADRTLVERFLTV